MQSRIPTQGYSEAIGEALSRFSPQLRSRLAHVRFVCGVDPVFAGLHRFEDTEDGRSYRTTAHCLYPYHLVAPRAQRTTVVVLPRLVKVTPAVIVHELGHALDHSLGFPLPSVRPVSWYAKTNRYEAFAEAFTTVHCNGYGDEEALAQDKETRHLFAEVL